MEWRSPDTIKFCQSVRYLALSVETCQLLNTLVKISNYSVSNFVEKPQLHGVKKGIFCEFQMSDPQSSQHSRGVFLCRIFLRNQRKYMVIYIARKLKKKKKYDNKLGIWLTVCCGHFLMLNMLSQIKPSRPSRRSSSRCPSAPLLPMREFSNDSSNLHLSPTQDKRYTQTRVFSSHLKLPICGFGRTPLDEVFKYIW